MRGIKYAFPTPLNIFRTLLSSKAKEREHIIPAYKKIGFSDEQQKILQLWRCKFGHLILVQMIRNVLKLKTFLIGFVRCKFAQLILVHVIKNVLRLKTFLMA